uniref:Putative ovule protein n=1 Tax=Solanum chacoense TaxID=4108 RepID=A0A0V0GL08_SOLCH
MNECRIICIWLLVKLVMLSRLVIKILIFFLITMVSGPASASTKFMGYRPRPTSNKYHVLLSTKTRIDWKKSPTAYFVATF